MALKLNLLCFMMVNTFQVGNHRMGGNDLRPG